MLSTFHSILTAITPIDTSLAKPGQARLDDLTKPKGSLGLLEDLALQTYMIQGGTLPTADPARCYTVAGDHGVVAEGVSLFPQEVTRQMVLNFVSGGAAINVLTNTAGAEIFVVDAGSCGEGYDEHPKLIQNKIAPGTANMAQGPAMTQDQCLQALLLGVRLADQAKTDGVNTLLTGDMGIGNTTPSTALYCAFLGLEPEAMTGPGTGLDSKGVAGKAQVIAKALTVNGDAVNSGDPLNILAALGGLEIATLAGLILGGAKNHQLVLVDGFISTAAYLAAWKLCPTVADYCVLSHASAEQGHKKAVAAMGLRPLLDLSMRLGEGTGAAMALMVVRAACDIMGKMATFSQAGVSVAESN